jgi:hypothetical protein
MQQLDAFIGNVSVAEKCYLTAGMTDATYSVPFTSIGVGTLINAGVTINENKNAIYSGGGIRVNYPVAPSKLVQGLFDGSVSITATANTVYALRFAINGVIDYTSKIVARHGSATSPAGTFSISLGCFIEGLSNNDILSLVLVNETSTTSVLVSAMSMSFAGEPEGNLVISGTTVLHNDVTGRDNLSIGNDDSYLYSHLYAECLAYDLVPYIEYAPLTKSYFCTLVSVGDAAPHVLARTIAMAVMNQVETFIFTIPTHIDADSLICAVKRNMEKHNHRIEYSYDGFALHARKVDGWNDLVIEIKSIP